jgi:hypothetical protein
MFKSTLKLLPTVIVAITTAFVTVTSANAQHTFSLTENSSTSLSVTFDGSSSGIEVINTALDQWTVDLPFGITGTPAAQWIEPENNGLVNLVQNTSPSNGVVDVTSDTNPLAALGSSVDGSSIPFGSDTSDEMAINAVYHDNAATSEVPEPGTIACLISGLSFIGLASLRRKR